MMATTRLTIIGGVFLSVVLGWALGEYTGAAVGLVISIGLAAIKWRGRQVWSWLALWVRRRRPIAWSEPLTVVNDRAGGGIRYQERRIPQRCSPDQPRRAPKTRLTSGIWCRC
jgi:hypothetical protein